MAEGHVPTLQDVQRTQLTRLDVVHLLSDPNINDVIEGCFVRVLLEIETGREDYRIFTVRGTERGATYQGFSSDPTASTDLYIDLNLPIDLRGINGIAFQLNSVSNSRITQAEYLEWCRAPGPQPTETEAKLQARVAMLTRHPILAARRPSIAPAPTRLESLASAAVSAPAVNTNHSINAAPVAMATIAPQRSAAAVSAVTRGSPAACPASVAPSIPDVISPDTALRAVMEELRESYAVFVNPDFEGHKTALLRTAERDLVDYLDKLREQINAQRQVCVVCMDRAPTVVTLPCKHKVLCRLCASQVHSCPCCRETAVEVFEPIEP